LLQKVLVNLVPFIIHQLIVLQNNCAMISGTDIRNICTSAEISTQHISNEAHILPMHVLDIS